ncbi:MAG: AzlD domain-containing protein [Peptococcaceae bacterium]|jgi:branched-subunit amino acid transport protein|nr:AzlD domain-containing protein [Peptococcaceae bacterium]
MNHDIILIILAMAVVTYGARALPFLLFRNKNMGGFLKSFVELVPVALLAALVIPEFFVTAENSLSFFNPFLLAGISTFLFARKIPNLFLCVLFGMLAYWCFDKIV